MLAYHEFIGIFNVVNKPMGSNHFKNLAIPPTPTGNEYMLVVKSLENDYPKLTDSDRDDVALLLFLYGYEWIAADTLVSIAIDEYRKRLSRCLGYKHDNAPWNLIVALFRKIVRCPGCDPSWIDPVTTETGSIPHASLVNVWVEPVMLGDDAELVTELVRMSLLEWSDYCGLHFNLNSTPQYCQMSYQFFSGPLIVNSFGRCLNVLYSYPRGKFTAFPIQCHLPKPGDAMSLTGVGVSEYKSLISHISGHMLGLSHSYEPFAIMNPLHELTTYSPVAYDDASRLQNLYAGRGARSAVDLISQRD